jgi:hypothetical protein
MTQNQHHNQAGMWKRVQQLHHVATSFRNRCNVGDQVNHASAAKLLRERCVTLQLLMLNSSKEESPSSPIKGKNIQ